ncbi:aldo/keto reductase [Limnoglobus roseus]|uniref:Aldo/keto reductase n=1 Tax=Limnoglobus roseus TaxID=2598579 RepID=A0A5C1APX9_9BACT|nr:aldo/keto reductase [Limnoglobus roseus]QEL20655.1 aldo/keto reductase [Limnoglobus roseus]
MERRTFLGMAATAALAGGSPAADAPKETVRGDMRYRTLGRTGEEVSLLGLGGHHIGRQKEEKESIEIIRTAIDAGVTFLDNCWDYHDGGSEVRMGKALQGGYRKKVFLMTKIDGRTKKAAAQQIEDSLGRLRTDVIDLVQFHEIIRLEDPDRIFADGAALEAVQEAKKAGKLRFVGFTGHKDPLVHLRMLEVAAAHGFRFDAVQMPLNVMDAHFRSFEKKVLPELVKEQVGVLGMKSLGDGSILKSKTATPVECLHYAMSLPTSVVVSGMDSLAILRQNLAAVKSFKPLTGEQVAELLGRTAKAAAEGKYERFKTTNGFDGTAKNPKWLGADDAGP